MASSVPAVQAKLYDVLQAATATTLAGIPVSDGDPGDQLRNEHVVVHRGYRRAKDWSQLGASRMREPVVVELLVYVRIKGATQRATEARAWQLAGLVETAVMADPKLGGLIELPGGFPDADCDSDLTDQGWQSQLVLKFAGTAPPA